MNNKKYFIIEMAALVFLFVTVVIQVLLFLNVSDRMSAIEAQQAVLECHLDIIRSDGLNTSH